MIVTFEGRMGTGKTTGAVGLAYTEYLKREVLRTALDCVLKNFKWDEAVDVLKEKYSVSDKVANGEISEALRIFQVEGDEAYRESIKVISADHLNFPYTHFDQQYLIEHMDDEELEDCIVILDEAFQFMDARATSKKINILFSYFIAQTRKRGVDLFVCTHHIDEVDKRLRRKPDLRGTCRFTPGPIEDDLPIRKRKYNWVKINFRNLGTGQERKVVLYGPAFWPLFETKERIPLTRRQMEIEL